MNVTETRSKGSIGVSKSRVRASEKDSTVIVKQFNQFSEPAASLDVGKSGDLAARTQEFAAAAVDRSSSSLNEEEDLTVIAQDYKQYSTTFLTSFFSFCCAVFVICFHSLSH